MAINYFAWMSVTAIKSVVVVETCQFDNNFRKNVFNTTGASK